jgi:6-phosphogluconolactonase (cycloisomerase 2 family)
MKHTPSILIVILVSSTCLGSRSAQAQLLPFPSGAPCEGDLTERGVFTMTNEQAPMGGNKAVAYHRNEFGELCEVGRYPTGGNGDAFGVAVVGVNQVLLSGNYLFVTNPGANNLLFDNNSRLSVFRIEPDGLVLTDVESTRGPAVRSVTRDRRVINGVVRDLVYVVNAGLGTPHPDVVVVPTTIFGYNFNETTGQLSPIFSSLRETSDRAGDSAQIGFTPDGEFLIVDQRNASFPALSNALIEPDNIETFAVLPNGTTAPPVVTAANAGDIPYGFCFAEATAGPRFMFQMFSAAQFPDLGGATSYRVDDNGQLTEISPFFQDGNDVCWCATVEPNGNPLRVSETFIYSVGYFNSEISRWAISPTGETSFRPMSTPGASSANPNGGNIQFVDQGGLDVAVTNPNHPGSQFLYVIWTPQPLPLGTPTGTIQVRRIEPDGELTPLPNYGAAGLPSSFIGLAAH